MKTSQCSLVALERPAPHLSPPLCHVSGRRRCHREVRPLGLARGRSGRAARGSPSTLSSRGLHTRFHTRCHALLATSRKASSVLKGGPHVLIRALEAWRQDPKRSAQESRPTQSRPPGPLTEGSPLNFWGNCRGFFGRTP